MPRYHRLGNMPHKRHTVFKKKDGGIHYEQLFGTIGFDGMSSLLYHLHPPTQVKELLGHIDVSPKIAVNHNIQMRALKGFNIASKKDYLEFYEDAFGGFEDLGSENTDTDSEGYVKIEEEDYNPNLEDWENDVDYDKYYNPDDKNDEFVLKNKSSLEEEISENENSFHTEDETESDEEIKQYLENNLYDSD